MLAKSRMLLLAALVITWGAATSLWAQCQWTTGGSIMYSSGCTSVGVNNTSPSWTLDVNGNVGVKGSPAIIRPSSNSDSDGLRYLGTQLVIGGLNQLAYNYSGSALAYIGSFYDGTELLRLQTQNGNGKVVFWQENVNNVNMKVTNGGATAFVVAGQQVGINTAAPAGNYHLDVVGNARAKNVDVYTDPGNDTTMDLASIGFKSRAAGGATETWSLFTAPVGGGYGVTPNALELYEYPPNATPACCRPRFRLLPSAPLAPAAPPAMILDGSGNLSIGGVTPAAPLHVNGSATVQGLATTFIVGSATAPTKHILIGYDTTNNAGLIAPVNEGTGWTNLALAPVSGNVGIGTSTPQYKLDVVGTIHATQVIGATYQDVAEWVPSEPELGAGTVVVLNGEKNNEVMASTHEYDTAVAGVVSAKPGVILGEASPSKAMIATTGRVKVHVDATRGPICVGDLLVTSDKRGLAMRSNPIDVAGVKLHRPGTLIGKALEPLASGEGEILVLLSLQ